MTPPPHRLGLKQFLINFWIWFVPYKKLFFSSLLEKRDVDALEAGSDTHKLFLEQGDLDDQKAKEVAEYIDAKNKEVIYRE